MGTERLGIPRTVADDACQRQKAGIRRRRATPEAIRRAPAKAMMAASSPVRGSLPVLDPDALDVPVAAPVGADAVVAVGEDPLPVELLDEFPVEELPRVPEELPPLPAEPPWLPPFCDEKGSVYVLSAALPWARAALGATRAKAESSAAMWDERIMVFMLDGAAAGKLRFLAGPTLR